MLAEKQKAGLHRQTGASVLTAKRKKELEAIAALPDETIDTSDIPELSKEKWKGAIRGVAFSRPETRHISIRLSSIDLAIANKLAARKGLPYQTYIKSLLHETLMKENAE
jgi:predicted DNA binding CopG/RHH family protein